MMPSSPFPGMDPYLEMDPAWAAFHGWFIRKLAEQAIEPARERGCQIDVERSIYGQGPTGELVLWGEPDALVWPDPVEVERWSSEPGGTTAALARPKAVHEVVLDPETLNTRKQEYIVVREAEGPERVLAVVELLSFANKEGSYAAKYHEKRSRILASAAHFMEIDLLRAGENPSRGLFPELPPAPYFIYVARKTAVGRNDEGHPLQLQDPLPVIGLPLGGRRTDLPLDLAAAFRSAYELGYRGTWNRYGKAPVPPPPLSPGDQAWVDELLESAGLKKTSDTKLKKTSDTNT